MAENGSQSAASNPETPSALSCHAGQIFNAENVTITPDGRIFVTGSQSVFELEANAGEALGQLPLLNLSVPAVPSSSFKNGICHDGGSLYLACGNICCPSAATIASWSNFNAMPQNSGTLLLLGMLEWICRIESYILQAELHPQSPPVFDKICAIRKSDFFANGLATNGNGVLYVANSYSGRTAGIYRLSLHTPNPQLELWHRIPGFPPNGIKLRDGFVYYTATRLLPFPSAFLVRVKIGADGSAGDPDILYRQDFSVFDDLAVGAQGVVIAVFSETTFLTSGSLLFVGYNGDVVRIGPVEGFKNPSAVTIVPGIIGGFQKGDLLVTEKARHCLSVFRPAPAMRPLLVA
jgi:hypothetical protein